MLGVPIIETDFRINDAVKMIHPLRTNTTYTDQVCIIVEICNGWTTIKGNNSILYLVDLEDLTYIGYKTDCIVTKDGDILLDCL